MKKYLTLMTTILCTFLWAISGFGQPAIPAKPAKVNSPATSPEQIRQLLAGARDQHKEVVIFIKKDALSSGNTIKEKTKKKRLRVSGWVCRFEESKIFLSSNSAFGRFFQFKDSWCIDLSDIESVRFQNKFETFGRRTEGVIGIAYLFATFPVSTVIYE